MAAQLAPQLKFVTADIETSPLEVHAWGLFNQNVGINQIMAPTRMISFAAKFYHKKQVEFRSVFHDGHEEMVRRAWEIVNEADVLITYNGVSFDMKHLNREFIQAGLQPASPVQHIDLLRVVKGNFRFASNKLQYVSTALGLKGKVSHEGHGLWVACMEGDEKAWKKMKEYNIGDVVLTEQLYDVLRPWIASHPHLGVNYIDGELHCPNCGSTELVKEGFKYTPTGTFQQYHCRNCGKWNRGSRSLAIQKNRGVE